MRKALILLVVLGAASLVLVFSGAALAQGDADRDLYLSAGYGVFIPGGDYEPIGGNDWENGADWNFSLVSQQSDIFAVGLDLHYYKTEVNFPAGIIHINVIGLEPMLMLQRRNANFQPYAAIGAGFYFNTVQGFEGIYIGNEVYKGVGPLIKGGARYFLGEKFFIGGHLKMFSNESEMDDGSTFEFGGSSMNFEVGMAF